MALFIHTQNHDLDNIADLHQFTGMPQTAVCYLTDVDQTILMHTDIHKYTEVDDIADRTGELHAGYQILHIQNIFAQDWGGQFVSGIPAGLGQFFGNIQQSGFAGSAFRGRTGDAIVFQLLLYVGKIGAFLQFSSFSRALAAS